jgi:hypothetical protein
VSARVLAAQSGIAVLNWAYAFHAGDRVRHVDGRVGTVIRQSGGIVSWDPDAPGTGGVDGAAALRHVDEPTDDVERDLAPPLTASLELLAAIERIEITEGHEWQGGCECHRKLSECTEVFNGHCSVECCALQIIWEHDEQQDQSPRGVSWCVEMIERSFARARERAAGGTHAAD